MAAFFPDLRYAVRVLLKSREFTSAAIAVLALGIGANSAIFSAVNTVLLRPLPFAGADRLVLLFDVPPQQNFPGIKRFAVSPADYLDWRAVNRSFDGMAAYTSRQVALTGLERPEVVPAAWVGGDFFSILRAPAQIGRAFTSEDDRPGRGRVAVISQGFWQSHFGSSPDTLGRTLIVNGDPFTIIGVAPPTLNLPAWSLGAADIWMPLAWNEEFRGERKNRNFLVVGRLKPGVALSQAQAEMDTISSQLERQYPDADRGWGAAVGAAARQPGGQRSARLAGPLGCGGICPADRVRQRREPDHGTESGAQQGGGGTRRSRRQPRPRFATTALRDHRAFAGRRACRALPGEHGHAAAGYLREPTVSLERRHPD